MEFTEIKGARLGERAAADEFHRDPIEFLDRRFPEGGDSMWLPGRQLWLAEPGAARAVLSNSEELYQEHSDFFHTRFGDFGPRAVQVAIGRGARSLLSGYLDAHASELGERVDHALATAREWPDAGNRLMYRHLRGLLLGPESAPALFELADQIVERAVLAGARERHSRLSRAWFRFRVERTLARAIEERRRSGSPPCDLLGLVAAVGGPDAEPSELGEVFLSFLFAIAGSVGFTLGWSLFLLASHPRAEAEPSWVVREALRLWPVAWVLSRRPRVAHEIAGVTVTPDDEVVACPYLVHRHPRFWTEPRAFRPERWAELKDQQAFLPFGRGPHSCIAAALATHLVSNTLTLLLAHGEPRFSWHNSRPQIGPALAPPRFGLVLERSRLRSTAQADIPTKGGEAPW